MTKRSDRADPDADACYSQHDGQNQGRGAFQPFMAKWMIGIRLAMSAMHADHHNDGTGAIGCGMDGIGNHRLRMTGNPGKQLKNRKQ